LEQKFFFQKSLTLKNYEADKLLE